MTSAKPAWGCAGVGSPASGGVRGDARWRAGRIAGKALDPGCFPSNQTANRRTGHTRAAPGQQQWRSSVLPCG
eukprot:8086324-Lingulodinium_polyedra.AAC.1